MQILEGKKCSSVKLFQLPAGEISGFDNTCLDNINKLRELWHKGENAVVYDQVSLINFSAIRRFVS